MFLILTSMRPYIIYSKRKGEHMETKIDPYIYIVRQAYVPMPIIVL